MTSPDTRPTMLQRRVVRAISQGEMAAREGARVTDCPYPVWGNRRQRMMAFAWLRGFTRISPPPTS